MIDQIKKRKVDVVVISDVHLGTYGCHAKELLAYMKSIKPKIVVLNGDIIDIWQFSKRYWPKMHMLVVKQIIKWCAKGVKVYYITGNHDEMLRKFAGFKLNNLSIQNKLILELGDQNAWIFHGDVFDVTMKHSKWLTRLGSKGYDLLILINAFCNFISEKILKRGKISISKSIKNSVKSAVKYINNFEQTVADIAISNQYDYVVCGHIHHPEIKMVSNNHGTVQYLNSGDWVENLTALEYNNNEWKLYHYRNDSELHAKLNDHDDDEIAALKSKELFELLIDEINSSTPVEGVKLKK